MSDKQIWVQNRSDAPVTVKVKDYRTGTVSLVKKFMPEMSDKWTGRVISTGYTALTEAEYKALSNGSPTFLHYKDKLKQLVVCDELPAEAKSPHEALRDARKDAKKAAGEASARKAENDKLKADLFDAEKKYKELLAASVDDEKVKSLTDQITALKVENEKLKADAGKASKKGGEKGKDFE
jgi:hypothetical protein